MFIVLIHMPLRTLVANRKHYFCTFSVCIDMKNIDIQELLIQPIVIKNKLFSLLNLYEHS